MGIQIVNLMWNFKGLGRKCQIIKGIGYFLWLSAGVILTIHLPICTTLGPSIRMDVSVQLSFNTCWAPQPPLDCWLLCPLGGTKRAPGQQGRVKDSVGTGRRRKAIAF
jgi:hypothetical protein